MPKTNHERNFVDKKDYSVIPGDFCKGKHGAAKVKRGSKKYRRTRQRFNQNNQTKKMVDNEDISLETTKFDKYGDKRWKKKTWI